MGKSMTQLPQMYGSFQASIVPMSLPAARFLGRGSDSSLFNSSFRPALDAQRNPRSSL
jgi:hypothetical protein